MTLVKLTLFAAAITALLLGGSIPTAHAANDVLVVKSAVDWLPGDCDADCTLRDAIRAANATAGIRETIRFNIPTSSTNCDSNSGICTLKLLAGLPALTDPVVIDGYTQPGAHPNTLAAGNDAAFRVVLDGTGVSGSGLLVMGGSSTIRGMVIQNFAASNTAAVEIRSDGNLVQGNLLGTDASGTLAHANYRGVLLAGTHNLVGGAAPEMRNLLSGNTTGIRIEGNQNRVQGNYIGTDRHGTAALANDDGIIIFGSKNKIGGSAGARNLISGNSFGGIHLLYSASNNKIIQNRIGTSITGAALGNSFTGIALQGNPGTGDFTRNNLISGNIIGYNSASGILMGTVPADTGAGNTFTRNSIFQNAGLGIDLAPQLAVNPNDPVPDADDGPNHLQNYPELRKLTFPQNKIKVKGILKSTPGKLFRIEFFGNDTCGASGYGQGKLFFGAVTVATNQKGIAHFAPVFDTGGQGVGVWITATATELDGKKLRSTSEFSKCLATT